MGRPERQNRILATTLAPPPARVTLPSNLAGSLGYLDDAQLQRLLEAVTVEIDRRNHDMPKAETATAAATGASSQNQTTAFRGKTIRDIDQIPEGRANLIRASFQAGIKPAAIARTFHISQALVSRVLSSGEKPKR